MSTSTAAEDNPEIIIPITSLVEGRIHEVFGQNTKEFQLALQKSNAVIAGSFITQSILGEYWENSDIDIYVPVVEDITVYYSSNEGFRDSDDLFSITDEDGTKLTYTVGGYLVTEIEQFMYKMNSSKKHDGCYQQEGAKEGRYCGLFGESIYGMREYGIGDKTIQVMQVNTKFCNGKIRRFIFESFDFDICKAYYGILDNNSFVDCADVNSILSKTCEFEFSVALKNSIERFQKYTKRGFALTFHGVRILDLYSQFLSQVMNDVEEKRREFTQTDEIPVDFLKKLISNKNQ